MYEFLKYKFNCVDRKFSTLCLENFLFNEGNSKQNTSRLKDLYLGNLGFDRVLNAILIKDGAKPIGVGVCEHYLHFHHAHLLSDPSIQNSNVRQQYEWGFQRLGKISLFVKQEYRNKGLGTELVKRLERARILDFVTQYGGNGRLPVGHKYLFEASDLGFLLWKKSAQISYVTNVPKESWNNRREIHFLTQEVLERDRLAAIALHSKVRQVIDNTKINNFVTA